MIPKVIHYCWFGGKSLPRLEKKCVDSWRKILPEYEIKRWDESNFNLKQYAFAQQAYKLGKYAFVADVCRLHALYENGGIYLDTDIEMLRPFENLHECNLFMGFETDNVIQTGVIGSEPHNPIIKEMLDYYIRRGCFDPKIDGKLANSELFANYLRIKGLSLENKNYSDSEITLLSSEYLCPINQATWEIVATDNSYCIHYLSGSWLPRRALMSRRLKTAVGKFFGFECVARLRNLLR